MKLIWLLLWAPISAYGQAAPASATPPPANGGFVGSAVCKACHPDVWLNFNKNPHFKSVASGKETPEHTGCEGCHGPGAAHVKARRGKDDHSSRFLVDGAEARSSTIAWCVMAKTYRAPISGGRSTPMRTWSVQPATPSIKRRPPSFCWPRFRRIYVTSAMPRCARSSICR